MSLSFTELAAMVDELENTLTQKSMVLPMPVDMSTVIADQLVNVLRNRVITSLRAVFIQQTGHLNVPAFLMFCNTYGFSYQGIDSGPVSAGFIIASGHLRISVR